MSTKPTSDPATLRDLLAPRSERLALTPGGFALRLKTSPRVRRLVPTRLAVRRAERIGASLWERDDEERVRALGAIEVLLGATSHSDRVEEFARAQLIENKVESALFWQPWRAPLLDDESHARLARAHAAGSGILLSGCHVRFNFLAAWALRRAGIDIYTVFGDWFFAAPSPDLHGRRVERWRRDSASRPVRGQGCFQTLRGLLEGGATVILMYDLPGPRHTQFLGKPAELADGTARLGVLTQAAVLPMRVRRAGDRVSVEVDAAIGQRHMDDPAALHEQLALAHEQWIIANAAAMLDPRDYGWKDGATAAAWRRPQQGFAGK